MRPRLLPRFVLNTVTVGFPPFPGMIGDSVNVTVKKYKLSDEVLTLHYILQQQWHRMNR